jgi:hypothetical protein
MADQVECPSCGKSVIPIEKPIPRMSIYTWVAGIIGFLIATIGLITFNFHGFSTIGLIGAIAVSLGCIVVVVLALRYVRESKINKHLSKCPSCGYQWTEQHIESDQEGLEAYFTGNDYLLSEFTSLATATTLSRRLLIIHGIAGVGKSTLLRMYELFCNRHHIRIATLACEETHSPVDALATWADDLRKDGVMLSVFQKTLSNYRAIEAKVEVEAKNASKSVSSPSGTLSGSLGKTAAKTVIEMAGSTIPIVGPLVGVMGSSSAEALFDWMHSFLTKSDLELFLDPVKRSTNDFLSDLARIASRQRVVLMIDSFELMKAFDNWLCDFAQQLHPNVLLVIAGRTVPNWDRQWPSWIAYSKVEELRPMTEQTMRTLVKRYYSIQRGGEPDPAQVEAIIRLARGLPLAATTTLQLWMRYGIGIEDIQIVKPQMMAELADRLTEGIPEHMRSVLKVASTLRWFDQEMLGEVAGEATPSDDVYAELRHYPFVRSYKEGLALHDSVREYLNENLRMQEPGRYREMHLRAANYFAKRRETVKVEDAVSLALEQLYHAVSADEVEGFRLFEVIAEELLRYSLLTQLRTVLSDVNTYPLQREDSRLWLAYYNARLEYGKEYAKQFSSLRQLIQVSSLSEIPTALASAEKEFGTLVEQQLDTQKEDELRHLLGRLNEAVRLLRQYNEEAPLSIRTVSLSETISYLENETRIISNESTEPNRSILLLTLSKWRELMRYEIRRLEGEAKLEFSTLEEITVDEMITLVLQIHNTGPAPASNICVKLQGEGFVDVMPDMQEVPSLAPAASRTLVFRGHSQAEKFIAEFTIIYDDLLAKSNERQYTASVGSRGKTREWTYIRNPYLPGKPDPDLKEVKRLFVGREDVLRFIEKNLVGAVAERIIVLYGQRRTGKTWILLHLQELLPAIYLPVYIDVQEFTGVRGVPAILQIFADQILTTLKERCELSKATLSTIYIPTFEEYEKNYPYYFRVFSRNVQEVLGERKLLWLFDEFQGFDDMVVAGNLSATFMEYLRHLMQFGEKMAFIFAGTREMTEQYWSVFFNITMQRKIGTLNDDDAANLITNPVKPFGVEHDRFAVPLIKQLTGNHPYFIQLLCDNIVSKLNERHQMLVNAQIIEAAVDDLVINGASNLKFHWIEVMDERERAVAGMMQELLRRGQPADVSTIWSEMREINRRIAPDHVSSTLKSLAEKDLLEKDTTALDTYKFKIGLVESYIGAHILYAETQGRIGKLW